MDENKVVEIKEEEAAQAAGGKKPSFNPWNVPQYYVIEWGDTLSEIAVAANTNIGALMNLNPSIQNPDKIRAGQTIRLW